jgi:hypothetical protein
MSEGHGFQHHLHRTQLACVVCDPPRLGCRLLLFKKLCVFWSRMGTRWGDRWAWKNASSHSCKIDERPQAVTRLSDLRLHRQAVGDPQLWPLAQTSHVGCRSRWWTHLLWCTHTICYVTFKGNCVSHLLQGIISSRFVQVGERIWIFECLMWATTLGPVISKSPPLLKILTRSPTLTI